LTARLPPAACGWMRFRLPGVWTARRRSTTSPLARSARSSSSSHEGGGFCGSIEDCQQRSQGRLGSTSADGDSRLLSEPYFSTDQLRNPLLHNWTKVFLRYCDGGYYSGDRMDTLPGINGTASSPMFFRGRYITEALVTDLNAR
jgi:hypothetical protein